MAEEAANNPFPDLPAQIAALTAAQAASTGDIAALTAAVSGLTSVVAASRDAPPNKVTTNSVAALKAAQQAVRKDLVGVNVLEFDHPFAPINTARAGFGI